MSWSFAPSINVDQAWFSVKSESSGLSLSPGEPFHVNWASNGVNRVTKAINTITNHHCISNVMLFTAQQCYFCRTPTRSDHEVRLSRPPPPTTHPPTTHPRHLAQRLKSALLTVPRPQTHTFSESSWQELFKDGNVTQIQWQWQWQIRWQRQRQWQRWRDLKLHIW